MAPRYLPCRTGTAWADHSRIEPGNRTARRKDDGASAGTVIPADAIEGVSPIWFELFRASSPACFRPACPRSSRPKLRLAGFCPPL